MQMLRFRSALAIALIPMVAIGASLLANSARAQQPQSESASEGTFFGYVPPDRGAPRRTRGAGSRGCQTDKPVGLTLLVPSDHTGRTIASHPTFAWHLSGATDAPIQFTLVQPGVAQPIYTVTLPQQPEGYGQLALPSDVPALAAGQEYRWSVEAICNPKRPSSNIFAQGWIARVEPIAELSETLAAATTPREEAIAYARAGIWFEALAALSVTDNAEIRADRLALMNDAGIELSPETPQ